MNKEMEEMDLRKWKRNIEESVEDAERFERRWGF
jgi:hypothetical protein